MAWSYERYGRTDEEYAFDLFNDDESIICGSTGLVKEDDARRVVACVNILSDVPLDRIERADELNITDISRGGLFSSQLKLQHECAELLAALKALECCYCEAGSELSKDDRIRHRVVLTQSRAVIVKAEADK